jgi:RNA polymerase sigma factor (sigma-70 family)
VKFPTFTDAERDGMLTKVLEARAVMRKAKKAERAAAERHYRAAVAPLVVANQGLVAAVAHRYVKQLHSLTLEDLMQEGTFGFMKAVDRFDPAFGVKLSTYAIWWIRASIKRATLNTDQVVRLPVHMGELRASMRRLEMQTQAIAGREPTLDEYSGRCKKKRSSIEVALEVRLDRPTSLDAPTSSGFTTTMLDGLESPNDSPEEEYEFEERRALLGRLLDELTPRTRRILELRSEGLTLQNVGDIMNLTRERIRQLEAKAIQQMKATAARHGYKGNRSHE